VYITKVISVIKDEEEEEEQRRPATVTMDDFASLLARRPVMESVVYGNCGAVAHNRYKDYAVHHPPSPASNAASFRVLLVSIMGNHHWVSNPSVPIPS